MKEISVGYVGPFCDNNFGDYGMLVNDIYDIGISNILIFSYNNTFVNNLYNRYLSFLDKVKICQVDVAAKNFIPTGKYYNVEYDEYNETPFEIISEVKNIREVEAAVRSINALIVTGGGWINDVWCAKHRKNRLKAILSPILLAAKYNIPVIYMGNTFGPLKKSENFFLNFFSFTFKNSIFACRDDFNSILEMKSLGITNINSIPDDFYFLNQGFQERRVNENLRKYIERGKYIIIENYLSLGELEKNTIEFKRFVIQMKEKYKVRVLFLPLGELYGGAYQAKFIKEQIPEIDVLNVTEGTALDITDTEEIIKNAQFIICQRYHLMVRAVANNIPVKQILKDVCGDKNYYYVKSMGLVTKLFEEYQIEENLLFGLDFWKELRTIQEQYLNNIKKWRKLYDNPIKKENEEIQKRIREKYIDKNIRGLVDKS